MKAPPHFCGGAFSFPGFNGGTKNASSRSQTILRSGSKVRAGSRSASREELLSLILDKLSDALVEKQTLNKFSTLVLGMLKRDQTIVNQVVSIVAMDSQFV